MRWAKIPLALMPDTDGDKVRAMRNMRRYIQKAEKSPAQCRIR